VVWIGFPPMPSKSFQRTKPQQPIHLTAKRRDFTRKFTSLRGFIGKAKTAAIAAFLGDSTVL
jgi:hypothetical protein